MRRENKVRKTLLRTAIGTLTPNPLTSPNTKANTSLLREMAKGEGAITKTRRRTGCALASKVEISVWVRNKREMVHTKDHNKR